MPPEKGMNEDKKARLDAIRAANAARKVAEGDDAEPAVTVAPVTVAPAVAPVTTAAPSVAVTPAKAGAAMSDEKKAKLEAIRAANASRKGEVVVDAAPAVAAPVAVQPPTTAKDAVATAPAAPAAPARSGTRVPNIQQGQKVVEDDRIPARVYAIRAVIGAVFGLIICVALASDTHAYLPATIWGILLGAALGLLVLSWPPVRTTGE
ncbi:MAG: hypothetical protein H0X37_22910 [Herpetosiphonaceae bacterium]|nr:hypothetical protein [Herpetosiphonaceae bacterium]